VAQGDHDGFLWHFRVNPLRLVAEAGGVVSAQMLTGLRPRNSPYFTLSLKKRRNRSAMLKKVKGRI
jgi:hypothetical protein